MNFKEVIESRYNRQNWQLLLHDIFGSKIKFWQTPSEVPTSSPFARQALWLGTITLSDEQTISVYEVELADSVDIERNRRGIRDMLLTDWRNNGNAGAFMFCYRKNESVLRFSYVSEAWKFADDGTYQKESTDTKRFTYLLGEGHRSRTAIQQFEKLKASDLSLKDLTKAFSVDAVSDMFFAGYKKQYEDIIFYVTGKRMVKVANKWEERQEGKPNAFIMQQFARFDNPEKAVRDYVKKLMGRLVFLQFLQKKGWMGVPVNKEWGEGDAEFVLHLFERCTDKDHFIDNVLEPLFDDLNTERKNDLVSPAVGRSIRVPYLNGGLFEREDTDETQFPLPGKYMDSLLAFFASYNFTIDENDPDDAEVGVDPEMLGRIFENLLEDNKDKGAFYTPKEIVSYMCRESLIAYLQTDVEDEPTKEAIRQFVTTHEVNALGTNDKFRQQVDEALKNVKICDPAIGSGAFPMGLLKELFLCRTAIEGIEQSKAAEIKKHIIQQNIYGVDIERGAVDIARLRFWLSLIVDEETPQALPNLDFKIMQGNSLLEQYKGVDLSTMTEVTTEKHGTVQLTWYDNQLDDLRRRLREMLTEYYDCTDHHKKQSLRAKIIDNVKQQLREQSINVDFGDLDLSGNNQFMLWHTWFYDVFSQGGFDIVIGNPPYIRPHKVKDDEKVVLWKKYYVAQQKTDIYAFFIEKGCQLLRVNGLLSFITPKTWYSLYSFKKLRDILLHEYDIVQIGVLPEKVFDSATVETALLFVINDNKSSDILFKDVYKDTLIASRSKESILADADLNINIEETQHTDSTPLGDLCKIIVGIVSGNDKKYCRYEKMTDLDKPCIRGTNISRYTINYTGEYIWYDRDQIIWDGNHKPKSSLKQAVGQSSPKKPEDFELPQKIVMQRISKKIIAALDTNQYYAHSSVVIIKPSESYDLKVILAILNSKYVDSWLKKNSSNISINIGTVKKIPIPSVTINQQAEIVSLIDKIHDAKRENPSADTSALESEIDRLVYHLYGLTEEEIKIVEQS
ncbi:MAG: N-6 DNA methylase [Bacteroidaceae bacterium]|nr:N-6 DNA methylase [Bacteroidaceae bacterium]